MNLDGIVGTPLDWLTRLPPGWVVKRFKFTASEWKKKCGLRDEPPPMLSVSGYDGVVPKQYDDENRKRLPEDLVTYLVVEPDQLVLNTMWLNYRGLGVSHHHGLVSPAYRSYVLGDEWHPPFAHHLLRSDSFVGHYTRMAYGIRPNSLQVNREDFASLPVPLPPLPVQRTIADFLDRKTAAIDALIEKKERMLALMAEKRAALIHRAVTKGLDPDVPMKDSGVPWIGEIPAHWEVRPLGYRSTMQGGSTPSKANDSFWGGEVPWVSPKDMKTFFIEGSQDTLTTKALRETSIRLVPPGSTLVVVRGMILARTLPVGFNTVPITLNQDMKALTPAKGLDPEFLAWQLRARRLEAMALIEEAGHGTKVFRTDLFTKMKILVPPEAEQGEIMDATRRTEDTFGRAQASLVGSLTCLREYRQALITAAVTGQLDIQGAA